MVDIAKAKLFIYQNEITFLGMALSKNGLYPDDAIILALKELK